MDKTNFEMVGEFMNTFGQEVKNDPDWPSEDTQKLRLELIAEELEEMWDAIENKDLVGVADALTDILYVTYGAGHAFGMDLDACFLEVHDSNMSKLGPDGRVIRREDGKVLKSENFFAPDLGPILGL